MRYLQNTTLVHADPPSNPSQYLPKLSEHIIQNEPDNVIDDPSSIFFDPNEKSDFVYTAVPIITTSTYQKYSPEREICYPDVSDIDNKHLSKALENHHLRESPISSEYDDSLDRTRSLPNTPSHKVKDNIFNEQYNDVSSRRNSLEFDPIGMDSDYHAVLNTGEDYTPALSPVGLSEAEVKKLYESSHEGSLVDDYVELNLYEENILQNGKINMKIKGYFSDAESVKTYQDSGIYDDDVFIDSPKPLTNEEYSKVSRRLIFGGEGGEEEDGYVERFSAFKTPMSSRQNSLESILSLTSPVTKEAPKCKQIETPTVERSWKTSTSKYSHVQAKVQCYRTKVDRSPSPGSSLKKKSPSASKPPMVFGKFNKRATSTPKSSANINPKVDSLSNAKHTPGGGERKIFKERLNFRENATARTDSHGIEMYSHLPEEFQEIARRLARQDHQLKRQESHRGRSLSRSRTSSRQSSISPTRGNAARMRRSRRLTPGNSISDIFAAVNSSKTMLENVTKPQPSLSRSSSVRSIPSTPHLSRQHPATALRHAPKSPSPGPSPKRKEAKSKSKQKEDKPKVIVSPDVQNSMVTSDHPSPVSKLYQFTTQNDSFGSPQYSSNPIFQAVSVH